MKKLRGFAALMLLVILILTGFQVYWLRENFQREEKTLAERTAILFRETREQLRDSIIRQRLQKAIGDSVLITDSMLPALPRKRDTLVSNAIRTARVVQNMRTLSFGDSIHAAIPPRIMLSLNGSVGDSFLSSKILDSISPDNIKEVRVYNNPEIRFSPVTIESKKAQPPVQKRKPVARGSKKDTGITDITTTGTFIFNNEKGNKVVFNLDFMMNDSLPQQVLHTKFAGVLEKEKIDVPFSISKSADTASMRVSGQPWVGRTSPYSLTLGNSFPYLMKRISLPILFSVFLVGLTILSFVLLYRSLRRQHRLAQMKNDLISNITHELKTPIATVGVAIEALKNFNAIQDPARTREYLDISQNELQRLELLVDKVLKLSMFENKEIELSRDWCDLGEIARDVITSLRLQAEKQQARITLQVAGETTLLADKLHLLSVIFNLLDNALKYSGENASVQVSIEEKGENIELKVKDNGVGIPSQYKDKIFEKFFRVPTGNTHNAKGHGLGLSYVAKVIQQHGGTISLDSHEGLGSTFTITLPKTKA